MNKLIFIAASALSLMSCLTVRAEKPSQVDPAAERGAGRNDSLEKERAGLGEAKGHAKSQNPQAAEAALVKLNRAKPGTAAWHMESAQRLLHLAGDMGREGQLSARPALIASALEHLQKADKMATDNRHRAAIQSMIGTVQERFVGDRAAAKASYEAAVQLAPERAYAAKEAVERFQKEERNTLSRKTDNR